MSSIVSEIKIYLAQGRTSDALSLLLKLSEPNKQIHDSILMVLAEFNDLNAARLRGTISNDEATLRQNKINEKVLMALDSFDSQGKVLPGSVVGKKNTATNILSRITVLFTVISIAILLIQHFWLDGVFEGRYFWLAIPSSFLGFWAFIAYLLAMVVSAFKK